MTNSRFQTESALRAVDHIGRVTRSAAGQFQNSLGPSLVTLLLGLHYRDWLAEPEHTLLEQMTSAPSKVLLFRDGRLIHPAGAPEIVSGDFASPALHHPDTIFTHRCRADADGASPTVLHTARIGLFRGSELMLGLCEPDRGWASESHPDAFNHLLNEWRSAFAAAAQIATTLESHLPAYEPFLVVNRASGRIVIVNERLGHLIEEDMYNVVGAEYSVVAGYLRKLMSARGLHLENLSIAETHLAVVSLLPERRQKPRGVEDDAFTDFFVHAMRNRVSTITTASSELENMIGESGVADGSELASIIVSEAGELHRLISTVELLAGRKSSPDKPVSVIEEIIGAVKETEASFRRPVTVRPATGSADATIVAPASALTTLTGTVLRAHLSDGPNATTEISISDQDGKTTVDIATRDEAQTATVRFHSQWRACSSRLARTLGFECSHRMENDMNLITTITIPCGEKIHA